jgi:hypothetical protein
MPTGSAFLSDVQGLSEQRTPPDDFSATSQEGAVIGQCPGSGQRHGQVIVKAERLAEIVLRGCSVPGVLCEGGLSSGHDDFRPPAGKSHGSLRDPVDDQPGVAASATGQVSGDRIGRPRHIRWVGLAATVSPLLKLRKQPARGVGMSLAVCEDGPHVKLQPVGAMHAVVVGVNVGWQLGTAELHLL